jgi:hypothetical protein
MLTWEPPSPDSVIEEPFTTQLDDDLGWDLILAAAFARKGFRRLPGHLSD